MQRASRSSSRGLVAAAAVVVALGSLAGCALDDAGLTGGAPAGSGGGAGAPGSVGPAGSGGGRGPGGAGGMGGAGGAGGVVGGTGGAPDANAACGGCAPCFRCGPQGCEPNPRSSFSLVCQSAIISPVKPGGMTWDSTAMPPPAAWPDAYCQVTAGRGMWASEVVPDSLMPVWNETVDALGGDPITAALLLGDRWTVAVIDADGSSGSGSMNGENVCTVTPHLTAADLEQGSVSFTDVGACIQLNLAVLCASP